jgi:hypothetical protein
VRKLDFARVRVPRPSSPRLRADCRPLREGPAATHPPGQIVGRSGRQGDNAGTHADSAGRVTVPATADLSYGPGARYGPKNVPEGPRAARSGCASGIGPRLRGIPGRTRGRAPPETLPGIFRCATSWLVGYPALPAFGVNVPGRRSRGYGAHLGHPPTREYRSVPRHRSPARRTGRNGTYALPAPILNGCMASSLFGL